MKPPKLTLINRIHEAKEGMKQGKQRAIYTPVKKSEKAPEVVSDDVIAEVVIMLREFTHSGDSSLLIRASRKAQVPLIPLLEFYHKALTEEADRFTSAVAAACWDVLSHEERMHFITNGSGKFADLRAALEKDQNDED